LPGIGPKSALRLGFYLLQTPKEFNINLAKTITRLKEEVVICSQCFGVSETEVCSICSDTNRDKEIICVVERADDVISFEALGGYKGIYHVLGGTINPLDHVGPDDLKIDELIKKVSVGGVSELILAMNPTMEGEATALYIKKQIEKLRITNYELKITRIGSGLPMGADLGFADQATLARALEGRREI
jgi:recombination protein RecR